MAVDLYQTHSDSIIAPASRCFAITPSDSQDLLFVTKAIYIGESGDLVLRSPSGTADVTFMNVVSGTVLDVRAVAIRATGTTAAALVGMA